MAEAHAEDMKHQRAVQSTVRGLIKLHGHRPEEISISGIQNPDIEKWATRKGIVFNKKQKVDIITK